MSQPIARSSSRASYDAPARLLFEAYSKPEHLKKWFGPVGWPLTLCEVDFREGGRLRFAMTGPSGEQNTPFGGEYLEIVPNRKIVFDNGFENNRRRDDDRDRHLRREGRQDDAHHPHAVRLHGDEGRACRRGFEQGTNSGLDQLADVVAALKAAGIMAILLMI